MKQVLQSLKDGTTTLVDVPAPRALAGQLLIRTSASLVSAGTERMLVEFGKANWFERARRQPDKVRMVLDKIRTDGLVATWEAVQSKLDQPLALGYSNVGVVVEVVAGVKGFSVGDRVVSNGKHAEVVCVPKHLCAHIPGDVTDEQAAFTVVGAVGLQGIRLAEPTLGECVVVTGLGLIGLLAVQILRAQGCRVMGIDLNPSRLALARQFGAECVANPTTEDVLATALTFSRGHGVDAVIIAAATQSNEPVSQGAKMCRQRGRIVLVGVAGLELSRADFYEKELSFRVSCSYGPGRYDSAYEDEGRDYPIGFVRWTEQRNFEAVLDLMVAGRLDVAPLVSHRFPIERAPEAYELLASAQSVLGLLLEYPRSEFAADAALSPQTIVVADARPKPASGRVVFLGAGNYASRVLVPAFKAAGAQLHTVVSGGGVSAGQVARKFGFVRASTDWAAAVDDADADAIVIATRHDQHAQHVLAALRAGRHVFCEKPLCLTLDDLAEIDAEAKARPTQLLMVGFNRRFSPLTKKVKELLSGVAEPKCFVMTVNAGAVSAEHWTQDRNVGGGRIVGEACHFVDLLRHLAGAPIGRWQAVALGRHVALVRTDDKATITLEFGDGSTGVIHYLANGHKGFPKERLEVFCAGRVLRLDNFRRLRGWGWKGFGSVRLWRQDKGHAACAQAFVDAMQHGAPAPIPLDEVLQVSRVSIELQQYLDT